jgi:adenylate kinase
MNPKTFIFTGRSGCGKGTQVELLKEYIAKNDVSKTPIFYLETGARFRDFIKGDSYSSKLSNEMYKNGVRQPDFLAVWMWSHIFINDLKGGEHIFIDGTPRSLAEAKVLNTAMKFYGRGKPYVVYLNVSRDWSEKKLLGRGRLDDDREDIKKRLDWYDKDVQPAVDFYKNDTDVIFLDINGEQPIEKVHEDIVAAIS